MERPGHESRVPWGGDLFDCFERVRQRSARDPATRPLATRLRFDLDMTPPLSYPQIGSLLGIGESTVRRWCKEERKRRAERRQRQDRETDSAAAGVPGWDAALDRDTSALPPAASRGPRYAAYDDATMALAENPFSWQEADFRVAGLVYRADGGTTLVMIGAGADGHVHLFATRHSSTSEPPSSLAKSIRALHDWGPLDALLHSPDHPEPHRRQQTHETLERLLHDLPFPFAPGPRSGDFRERLTEILEAGQFTIAADSDAGPARQELRHAATGRDRGAGPALTALGYALERLTKLQEEQERASYPAYDDATLAVAQPPFSWPEAAQRYVGLVYSAPFTITAVVVGVGQDGQVHQFAETVTDGIRATNEAAARIGAFHRAAPVDALLHGPFAYPKQWQIHGELQSRLRDAKIHEIPVVQHTLGPDPGRWLRETLVGGKFTIAQAGCPASREELRVASRSERPEGPALTAICCVLDYLQQRQEE
ncbi:MAG: hypothetical protein OXG19_09650 [Chloroflexi bacterium]|nr:hypothetical protein [Chloroflexota bacterium]